jgi:hypothetical protein
MQPQLTLTEILALFALGLSLWYLWFVLAREYFEHKLREDLFAVRDEFFDAAVAGTTNFDSEAYRRTRLVLNGMIRYAHEFSFLHFLVSISVASEEIPGRPSYSAFMDTEMKRMRDTEAALYADVQRKLARAVLAHFFRSSVFLWVFGLALYLRSKAGLLLTAFVSSKPYKKLEHEAEVIGISREPKNEYAEAA